MKLSIYKNKIILSLFLFISIVNAQEKLELFPSYLLIQPFTANTLKPKFGFEFKTDKNELSLNVGNSMDIFHYKLDE